VKNAFAKLRFNLIEPELERYRWLAGHTAKAIEKVTREIKPGMSEHEIEGAMAQEFLADQILPTVLMVATDERTMQFRHPIPSEKKLEKYAQLICCTERWGVTATMTRSVHFGEIPANLRKKQEAAAYVDAVFISSTQPGARIGDIFKAAKSAYAQQGYPDEWMQHHQGGLTGYEQREYIAFPESDTLVEKNQAFGWNPTIQGAKSEDTILTTDAMPEIISMTKDWPRINVDVQGTTIQRPAILVR
jgi:Xaa-Pro aminopeptidase